MHRHHSKDLKLPGSSVFGLVSHQTFAEHASIRPPCEHRDLEICDVMKPDMPDFVQSLENENYTRLARAIHAMQSALGVAE